MRLGDKVMHLQHDNWGIGEVIEERHSKLAGGGCFVRIVFEDGNDRSFINDLDHQCCCYYSGIRLLY
ncbi:MAG: DUF3553 domain-containing protein [Nitrospirae bacterium]|nr:DUF3553 domain-containing protein [Nitrospirota bacterium]MBF0591651.1 DUF3553 domain-containing protein [Nitrospirota bacterium]